jgi:colanic acid/amylovoran biosynthesis glycosyltransferase
MRLVYLTVSMPFGSSEAFFIPEVNELRRRGHELLIVPRSPQGTEVLNHDAVELPALSVRRPTVSPGVLAGAIVEAFTHPAASLRVLAVLFKSRDLCTLAKNLLVLPKGLWLAHLAKRWKADHIHAQWGTTTATMALIASRISHIPWSCTVHRGDIIADNLLELKARQAQFFRIISDDGVNLAADVCGRPLEGNVVVLRLGVECPTRMSPSHPLHAPPVLICPALLIERKGQQYLLEAAEILRRRGRPVRLLLAGEGEMRPSLESIVARYNLGDSVQFLGHVGHTELLGMYQAGEIDMVVLPTLHEGIPVCLMEAMAYGVPIVSTPAGGIPELLRDGAGIMVPCKDPAALADAVERVLNDGELQKQLRETGRRRVEEEYSVKAVTDRLIQYIQNSADKSQ